LELPENISGSISSMPSLSCPSLKDVQLLKALLLLTVTLSARSDADRSFIVPEVEVLVHTGLGFFYQDKELSLLSSLLLHGVSVNCNDQLSRYFIGISEGICSSAE